LMRKNIK